MLTDNNNNNVHGFIIGDDGVVYGHINGVPTSTLSEESCNLINKTFNSEMNICHWSESPILNVYKDINKTIINQDFSDVYVKDECDYYFSFDYIYEIKTSELTNLNGLVNNMNNMVSKIKWNIGANEITAFDFDDRTMLQKLTSNEKTGLYATGNFFTQLKNSINNQLNLFIEDSKLRSGWISFRRKLTPEEKAQINYISIGLTVENPFKGVVIKFDNFRLDEVCNTVITSTRTINNNQSIKFDRVMDNKKSWSVDDKHRKHDVLWRDTNYQTADDREILNSKEIDLALSYTNAIEENFAEFIRQNRDAVIESVGDNPKLISKIDSELYLNDYTNDELLSRFVSVINSAPSYRTTSLNYVVINIFNRYMELNSVSYENLTKLMHKLDKYWVDIIAQFVPSTSIWESNLVYGTNNMFRDKFIYPRYSLEPPTEHSLGGTIHATVKEGANTFNNVPLSFEFYNMGGEYYRSEIDIQYNVVLRVFSHHPYSTYDPYQLCGVVKSPLKLGSLYTFEIGAITYDDVEGINPIVGDGKYRRFLFEGAWYAVKINPNGVIMDIVNLDTCPVLEHISFIVDPQDFGDYDDACSGTLYGNPRANKTLYASSFEIGEMVFNNSTLNNADDILYENNVWKIAIYDGVRYAIRFIHENEIADIVNCDELLAPFQPNITYCEGGAYKIYVVINYQIDADMSHFEFTITSNVTNESSVINVPYQSSGTMDVTIDTPNNGIGEHTVTVRAFKQGNPIPSPSDSIVCSAFGYSLYAMREVNVEPCQTFPPTITNDRTVYSATSNLGEIRRGVQLFSNAQMTQPIIARTGSRISLATTDGTQMISTSVNERGFVTDVNFCSGSPVKMEIISTGFMTPNATDCNNYYSLDRITVYNNESLTVGSRFFLDTDLTQPLNMERFNNFYMLAKVPSETSPRYIYIENDVVAQIGRPCN